MIIFFLGKRLVVGVRALWTYIIFVYNNINLKSPTVFYPSNAVTSYSWDVNLSHLVFDSFGEILTLCSKSNIFRTHWVETSWWVCERRITVKERTFLIRWQSKAYCTFSCCYSFNCPISSKWYDAIRVWTHLEMKVSTKSIMHFKEYSCDVVFLFHRSLQINLLI